MRKQIITLTLVATFAGAAFAQGVAPAAPATPAAAAVTPTAPAAATSEKKVEAPKAAMPAKAEAPKAATGGATDAAKSKAKVEKTGAHVATDGKSPTPAGVTAGSTVPAAK